MNFLFILSYIGDIIINIGFRLAIPVPSISKGEIFMNLFAVSFFGHREIDDPFVIERQLEAIIRELLLTKEYVEFLVGRDGEFDQLVSSTVRRCKRTIRGDNSSLVLVLPYMTAEYRNNEESFHEYYDEIEICLESAEKHLCGPYRRRSLSDHAICKKGRCKDHESARCTSLTFALFFSERKNMNTFDAGIEVIHITMKYAS